MNGVRDLDREVVAHGKGPQNGDHNFSEALKAFWKPAAADHARLTESLRQIPFRSFVEGMNRKRRETYS